jgi:hypothetical protein
MKHCLHSNKLSQCMKLWACFMPVGMSRGQFVGGYNIKAPNSPAAQGPQTSRAGQPIVSKYLIADSPRV